MKTKYITNQLEQSRPFVLRDLWKREVALLILNPHVKSLVNRISERLSKGTRMAPGVRFARDFSISSKIVLVLLFSFILVELKLLLK